MSLSHYCKRCPRLNINEQDEPKISFETLKIMKIRYNNNIADLNHTHLVLILFLNMIKVKDLQSFLSWFYKKEKKNTAICIPGYLPFRGVRISH